MSNESVISIMDPSHYRDAVNSFINHFSISQKRAGIELLEVLHNFSNIPYENISKIIKYKNHHDDIYRIRLPDEIMEGYLKNRLGGTCFSLTNFLQIILKTLGFGCYPVMADMRWGKNVHCALVVLLDGEKFLVDPGYLVNHPLNLSQEREVTYKAEFTGIRLVAYAAQNLYDLYTFDYSGMKWRYRFKDRPVSDEEFFQHWLDSFGWKTMNGICINKVEENRRIYVHKTFMRESFFNGKRNFNIKSDYHLRINEVFGIPPELVEEALSALQFNLQRRKEMGLWVPKK